MDRSFNVGHEWHKTWKFCIIICVCCHCLTFYIVYRVLVCLFSWRNLSLHCERLVGGSEKILVRLGWWSWPSCWVLIRLFHCARRKTGFGKLNGFLRQLLCSVEDLLLRLGAGPTKPNKQYLKRPTFYIFSLWPFNLCFFMCKVFVTICYSLGPLSRRAPLHGFTCEVNATDRFIHFTHLGMRAFPRDWTPLSCDL